MKLLDRITFDPAVMGAGHRKVALDSPVYAAMCR